jgi:hypothetical protein
LIPGETSQDGCPPADRFAIGQRLAEHIPQQLLTPTGMRIIVQIEDAGRIALTEDAQVFQGLVIGFQYHILLFTFTAN